MLNFVAQVQALKSHKQMCVELSWRNLNMGENIIVLHGKTPMNESGISLIHASLPRMCLPELGAAEEVR